MDLSEYVRNLAYEGTEMQALDNLSKLAELPDMRVKISSALMGNERPEFAGKRVVAHIAEKFLATDDDKRHPLLMSALLLLGKLSQGSLQSAKCLAVGEVLDAMIGLVVNYDDEDREELTMHALTFFQQLVVYKELRPTLMKTNWLLQELVAISDSSEKPRSHKAAALSIIGSFALEESNRKKLLKLPLKLKETLMRLLDVEVKGVKDSAEVGQTEVLEKLLWLLRSFCKDLKTCAEVAADEDLIRSLLSEKVLFCHNGRIDDHVLCTLESMISLGNKVALDTMAHSGIIESFVRVVQESGTTARKWKQNAKKLCKLVYMLATANCLSPVASSVSEEGSNEPSYFNSTLSRLRSNTEALPLLLPLIGSVGDIGTHIAVITALAFGDKDGTDNALLAKPVGPKSLLDVLLERLEGSMKGDMGEERPYSTLLAVALSLSALSLSDVNASWMHTRKEIIQEMKEAIEEMHSSIEGSSATGSTEKGEHLSPRDGDLKQVLLALDFAIGRCRPISLTTEMTLSPASDETTTNNNCETVTSLDLAEEPAQTAIADVVLVEAVLAEMVLKMEHGSQLEMLKIEHDAEMVSQRETLEKQLVTQTELFTAEKKGHQDVVAKAIVSTLASSLVHAEVSSAAAKAAAAIDHKLHITKKLTHEDSGHASVDLSRALKESHAQNEVEHQKAALAAAEHDLKNLRIEMHKCKEEAAQLRVKADKSHQEAQTMKLEAETHQKMAAEHKEACDQLSMKNKELQRELETKTSTDPSDGIIVEQGSPGSIEQGNPVPPEVERPSQLSPRSASTNTLNASFASPASMAISEVTNSDTKHSSLIVGGNSNLEDAFASSTMLNDARDADALSYISNPAKAVNVKGLNSLLDNLGVSHSYELSHMEQAEVEEIARMLKPVPRKVFIEKMKSL